MDGILLGITTEKCISSTTTAKKQHGLTQETGKASWSEAPTAGSSFPQRGIPRMVFTVGVIVGLS